jgi:pimeloyl-ACP methyl ester carboxylesterase
VAVACHLLQHAPFDQVARHDRDPAGRDRPQSGRAPPRPAGRSPPERHPARPRSPAGRHATPAAPRRTAGTACRQAPCSTRSSPAWSRTNRGWEPTITAEVSPLGYLAVYVLALTPRHVRSRRRPDRDPPRKRRGPPRPARSAVRHGGDGAAHGAQPRRRRAFGRWFANCAAPPARGPLRPSRVMLEIDARPLLPLIHAPTLVLHRTGNPLAPIEHGHYLAKRIPDTKLIELTGSEGPLLWQADIAPDHIEEFLGSLRRPPAPPGYWRPCCLPTSSRPPARPAGSGIGAGVSCWTCTTSWPAGSSRSSRAAHQDDR